MNMLLLYGIIVPSKRQTIWKKNHNEAARIVTGATKLATIQSLLSDTGWESLAPRKEKTQARPLL